MLIVSLLKKGCKSIQNTINELFMTKTLDDLITASAYTQARKKLKHTAFKELNALVLKTFMEKEEPRLYKGYRLLGVDGSILNLPDHASIAECFKKVRNVNQTGLIKSYSSALFMACYDVLNKVCLDADLVSSRVHEVTAFQTMMNQSHHQADPKSIMIFDRCYTSYEMIHFLESRQQLYVIRVPRNSFKESQSLFHRNCDCDDKTVLINSHAVRFVRIVLSSGDVEVLATNLYDVSVDDLGQIYHHRWGVETFFLLVKDRLSLENFTGKTVESVFQDFWSTIFLSNLEANLTHDLNRELFLKEKPTHINKCVSFHVLKYQVFDLLYGALPQEEVETQLISLFLTGKVPYRKHRTFPTRKPSKHRTIRHLKYMKKCVF
jgi:hypothetical protein